MKKKGLMAKWVAETVECTPVLMSEYITGKKEMGVLRAVRLSGILGCSVEDLFPIKKQKKELK